MAERSGARVVTQHQLEDGPPAETASPALPPEPPTPLASSERAPPPAPSNRGLIDRQMRWLKERARFESKRPDDEGSK